MTMLQTSPAGLAAKPHGSRRFTLAIATPADRRFIYALRHEVYAEELHQHDANETRQLSDALDAINLFIVAKVGGRIIGCVSVTPPGHGRFSIDKYVDRLSLPFELDATVFEARLLTVAQPHRRGPAAGLLMYAALRWIESRGGRRIFGIGRREVMSLYRKVGLVPAGVTVQSGEVSYELMHATTEVCHRALLPLRDAIERLGASIDWRLDMPFDADDGCYHGGAFFEAIGDEFDDLRRREKIINADVLDAWFDPSPLVTAALTEHLPWLLRTSPPTNCEGMSRAIARARGVEPANILPGAGSSDLIYLSLRHWLTPSSRVLILDPMYGEYAHVLEKVIGCEVDRLTLTRDDGFALDPQRLIAVSAVAYDLIVLVNPNSPTGQFVDRHALKRALGLLPSTTRLWVDETYIEYAGSNQSLETWAVTTPNVVVCKSMSKVYALSGARAAYLCGSAATLAPLRRISPPWAVSLPAQVAAVAALKDPRYYEEQYELTRSLRGQLVQAVAAIESEHGAIEVLPGGVGNFILCALPEAGPSAAAVVERCRRDGVFLRDVGNMGGSLGAHMLRIAVKSAAENERIIAALREALS